MGGDQVEHLLASLQQRVAALRLEAAHTPSHQAVALLIGIDELRRIINALEAIAEDPVA